VSIGVMTVGGRAAGAAKRDPLDFDPTPPEATAALVIAERQALARHVVWEPACGDGRMVDELVRQGVRVGAASDVADRAGGRFPQANFLAEAAMWNGCSAIVTNPPFNQADKFIAHALGTLRVPYLALLLKATFWHAAVRIGPHRRFPPTAYLPICWRLDFRGQGNPVMDCQWVVWDAAKTGTCRVELLQRPDVPAAVVTCLGVRRE